MSRHKGRRRTDHHEEESHEGSERWLVTYADMLTLLLVLFIVLYSISKVNTSKLSQLRSSLASALGGSDGVLDGQSGLGNASGSSLSETQPINNSGKPTNAVPDIRSQAAIAPPTPAAGEVQVPASPRPAPTASPSPGSGDLKKELDEFAAIEKSISEGLSKKGLAGDAQYSIDQRGLVVTIVTDALVFPGNSADLLPGGQQIFDAVVPPLMKITNFVEIDGHTNQLNTSTAPYPSGWELSSARASAVVRYLIQRSVPTNRLSAVGFSDQRPLYPPADPRAITGNRRVDIVVLSNLPASERASLPAPPAR